MINLIKKILYSKDFIDDNKINPKDFTRKRKLSFANLFLLLARFRNHSMQSEVESFLEDCHADCQDVPSLDDSAVFKARHKMAPAAFKEMNLQCLDFFMEHGEVKRWNGYQLIDVDGSILRLPDTGDISEFFTPNTDAQGNPVGPPLARMNLLYDPLNQLCLAVDLDSIHKAEIHQFVGQEWPWKPGQLFIGDRHYDAFWLFVWLLSQKVDFCIRLKKDYRRKVIREFLQSGQKEQIVQITPGRQARRKCRQNQVGEAPIRLRLIRVDLPDGEVEILATSLLDGQAVDAEEFQGLYHLRWPIEEKIKQLKFRVNLENWSGKSALTVFQDVFSRLWGCNLTVWMSHGLEPEIVEKTRRCQYDYQINWAHAFAIMNRWSAGLFKKSLFQKSLNRLRKLFLEDLSPIRPKRQYNRKHKTYKREFYMCYKFCC